MRNETSRMKRQLDSNDDVIHKQDAEIQRLASMIRRMDEEALTQRKEYDQVINERDILGTQLIRRNDELALLYEKLKIQMSTLRKGEAQYAARLQDVRVLRLKIRDLMRELSIAKGSTAQLDDLKPELVATQRELLQEKTKVRGGGGGGGTAAGQADLWRLACSAPPPKTSPLNLSLTPARTLTPGQGTE